MKYCYTLGLLLAAPAVLAQTAPPALSPTPTPAAPPDTLLLQGHPQPTRAFLTVQDQLRTVAGVQVTPYDGRPGSGQVLRIRGAGVARGGSQGTQPLYVVDGLPALNNELTPDQPFGVAAPPLVGPTYSGSSYRPTVAELQMEAGANPLQLLPPEAIASVEVLAGPAAVARYGPLAANGVVSIRTRSGRELGSRPLQVRYSVYGGVQQVRRYYPLLTAPDYAAIVNERDLQGGGPASFISLPTGAGTDWQRELYGAAGLQQHQLSLGGQTGQTGYLLSADYRQQAGVLRGSALTRYGMRLALDQRALAGRVVLRGVVALGQSAQRLPYTAGLGGATVAALLAPPTTSVRDAQGNYREQDPVSDINFVNPLRVADNVYYQPTTRRLLTQLEASVQLLPGLTARLGGNFERTVLDGGSYWQPPLYYGGPGPSARFSRLQQQLSQWQAHAELGYEHAWRRHRLSATLAYDQQSQALDGSERQTQDAQGIQDDDQARYSTFSIYSYHVEYRPLRRTWGRLAYSLDSLLDVEVSASWAGATLTSLGGQGEATGLYPAAQVSWHPRVAALLARQLASTLWVGAGRTSLPGFGFGFGMPARLTSPNGFPYGDYRFQAPYVSDQLEAGLRLGSAAGRWSAQLVAYQRTSQHALLGKTLPVTGYGLFGFTDEATIRNQGLELTLAGRWQAGRVAGNTTLAASWLRNRVQGDQYAVQTPAFPESDNQPLGSFYGFRQQGLAANGQVQYEGALPGNGYTGLAQVLGNPVPGQLLSLSQQLSRGRLALDLQLDALLGYQVLNYQRYYLDTPNGFTNNATTVLDRWTPTHPNTSIPATSGPSGDPATDLTAYARTSSRLLENGSHLRLSSLTVSYALAQRGSQQLTLWAGVQNLFVLTGYRGYDPNVSSGGSSALLAGRDLGATPVPRTWLLGIRTAL